MRSNNRGKLLADLFSRDEGDSAFILLDHTTESEGIDGEVSDEALCAFADLALDGVLF